MFTQEFKRLCGDIDSQIYGTIDENGNLVNSDNYNQYLNAIKNGIAATTPGNILVEMVMNSR